MIRSPRPTPLDSKRPRETKMPSEEQVLRYAADLARLYAQASQDRRALRRLEERLVGLTEASLSLAQALSLQDLAERLGVVSEEVLGLDRAAVYVFQDGRHKLLSRPETRFPAHLPLKTSQLTELGTEPREVTAARWTSWLSCEQVVLVPLRGRERHVGLVIGEGHLPRLKEQGAHASVPVASLLAAHAGIVLENLLLEATREDRAAHSKAWTMGFKGMVGSSPAMQQVFNLIGRLGRVDSSVLVTGETGTGKALVARALHSASPHADGPFVTINCAAIPEQLVESELFGHEAGAFTGATKRHRGRVEMAAGGTLFLDEIGELPLSVQSKLLVFLEERKFTRVGGEKEIEANVRVISATNRDLAAEAAEKRFRSDLLYRLNVFTVHLPPLRDRGRDVLQIAEEHASQIAERYALPAPAFDTRAQTRLLAYHWPGNVRELRNVIEKAVILSGGGPLPPELLPADRAPSGMNPRPVDLSSSSSGSRPSLSSDSGPIAYEGGVTFAEAKGQMIEQWEASFLTSLLEVTQGNVAKASRMAKMDKKHLHRKINQYEIDVESMRSDG